MCMAHLVKSACEMLVYKTVLYFFDNLSGDPIKKCKKFHNLLILVVGCHGNMTWLPHGAIIRRPNMLYKALRVLIVIPVPELK